MTLYQTHPDLIRTDFTSGHLQVRGGGTTLRATDAYVALATAFQTPLAWDSYADRSRDGARRSFDEMRAAGFILPVNMGDRVDQMPLMCPGQTMFNTPWRQLADITPGEIVFVGAPLDVGTTGVPGARFGPQAIRTASVERYEAILDLATGRMQPWNVPALGGAVLGGARLSDAGDLPYTPGAPLQAYYDRLRDVVRQIHAAQAFPVVLGGDHSITYATVPAGIPALIHIDAHCDLAELRQGHCHHHGNVVRRLVDEARADQIYHLGLRDTSGQDTQAAGTHALSVGDLERPDWVQGLAGQMAFVSLDVDVLDPTVLPGTGTPVMGGLSLRQLCQILAKIAQHTRPVGLDIVELCPLEDRTGLSERTVIEALLCFLAVYHAHHGTHGPE